MVGLSCTRLTLQKQKNTSVLGGYIRTAGGWLLVVGVGLFVPLMDNDSAHHANIALRMYLTGDYTSLIDYDGPYLDKPHLHFWLSALSYHVFGVNGFAYKLPSFLFSIMGIWAVYRAATLLVNKSAGKTAAIVFGTSASFLLGLNDVRMDAILTAAVAITVWQLAGYIKTRGWRYVIGVALGMAIGFSTKGYVGVFIPGLFFLAYCLFVKNWRLLFDYRWVAGILLFSIFISPVLISYYIQYNLHPELIVRGENKINGVRFILWDQTLGRYGGEMGGDAKSDRLFFIHTFLWVFAPWSLVGITSLLKQGSIKSLSVVAKSALAVLFLFGILVGFSSFKLPHYINVILPVSAIWVSDQLSPMVIKRIIWVEWLMWALVGVFSGLLLVWWFPEQPMWFWLGLVLLFTLLFYTIRKVPQTNEKLPIRISMAVLVLFWLLNAGFYRSILHYQGGTRLADLIKDKEILKNTYSLQGCYSSSLYFNTQSIRKEITTGEAKVVAGYILYDIKQERDLINSGIRLSNKIGVQDYEITKLTNKFLNPGTRKSACTELVLAKLN